MGKTPFLKTKTGLVVAIVVGLILIFFIGSEYRAYQVRKAFSDVFNTDVTATKKNTNIIEKRVGEEFELATIKVKVNGAEDKSVLSSQYGSPAVAKENSKFVVVNLDVTNITKDTFTFGVEVNLTDTQERTYETYSDTIGNIDNYLDVRDLSPSITENGVLVFELPNDATSYAFAIDKAGTNDRYMVKLK